MVVDTTRQDRIDAVTALETEFGELVARYRRVLSENAARLSPGLLPAAYKVFTTIVHRGSVSQSALGEILLADKGQISRTVRELSDLGLIERNPDPADGRSVILAPTAAGLERLAVARAPREGALVDALATWRLDDIRALTRLLHALTVGETPDPS